jgi:hypothetical protein
MNGEFAISVARLAATVSFETRSIALAGSRSKLR